MNNAEFLSDMLYCAHMGPLPESTIKEACERFGIEFPPKQFKGFQATHKAPVVQQLKEDHGIHCN